MKSYSQRFHAKLALYFDKTLLYFDHNENKTNNRKLAELPWQQTKAKLIEKITTTLLNIEFVQAKLIAKMSYELLSDYKLANINTTEIGWMQSFLLTNLSNLQRYPDQLFNLIYFHGNSEIKQKTKETFLKTHTYNSLFLSEDSSTMGSTASVTATVSVSDKIASSVTTLAVKSAGGTATATG